MKIPPDAPSGNEQESLQRENQELRRQVEELKAGGHGGTETDGHSD